MGTLESEQVFLKWNNFETNLASGFADLLQQEAMVDVTLAVEGKLVQAHKIVLSVCSSYFRNIFQLNPCQHPIVILKDVRCQELTDMLDFMYRGEANVKQQDLPSFLRLAETLKVKGLAGGCSELPLDVQYQNDDSQKELGMINAKESSLNEIKEESSDISIRKSGHIIRKKRKKFVSPMKALNFKNKFCNTKHQATDAFDNNVDCKYSYLNDIECINVKEEQLNDESYENCNEEIAENETLNNRLLPCSSKIDEALEIIPQESMISRRASKPLSFIWSFFNFDCHKNKSQCKLCGKIFKACPKTGTASVKYHLNFAHQVLRTDGAVQ